ncbi:NPHP1 [Bugula neritina]|uniref:NPHP1 n=1 Tax=Bugula neritina TaxID=10212 RepID=A0A7J7IRB3_BUGNE|nr:NPHP1 [Bugula neritina]
MSGKTPTPSLKHLAKEADTLKKKLDKLQKECATVFNNPSASNRQDKLKRFYQDCVDMRNDMTDLNNRITKMTKADEPTKMSNFDSKKDDEVKRLTKMLDQVKEMEKKLEPDETEEDYYRKIKEELNSEEDGVDEDEEYEEEGGRRRRGCVDRVF